MTTWSGASLLADEGLQIVDNVLSFAKPTPGTPSKKEQALFLSSTAMAYAIWENYVEQVALELVTFIAEKIKPSDVPDKPKQELTRKHDAWDLSVHPGWRALWVDLVKLRAVGGSESDFGLNTAGSNQVTKLFEFVGVVAFQDLPDNMTTRLDQLVHDRGTIVHTARPPSTGFKKADATGWRTFVKELYEAFDISLHDQTKALMGYSPW